MTARKQTKQAPGLLALPGVGPATVEDLARLGITRLEQLAGRDAADLYNALGVLDGVRHDICVRDIFESLIVHANGGPLRPWSHYSRARKRHANAQAGRLY